MGEEQPLEHPPKDSFEDDVKRFWKGTEFGVSSGYANLRRVLLHRPGPELRVVNEDPKRWMWQGKPDLERAHKEFDLFAKTLKAHGVKVELMKEAKDDKAKQFYMRDQSVVIRTGAIVGRMALEQRRGEEAPVMKQLVSLGIPILHTVHGRGTFEGGNLVWLGESRVAIGEGLRTNQEGLDQVKDVMKRHDIDVLTVPLAGYLSRPSGYVHLDVVLNVVDEDLALVYPEGIPYAILQALGEEFDLVEVGRKEQRKMGANVLVLGPRKVLARRGNVETKRALESEGAEVVEVDMDELTKGGGGPRCVTLELERS